MSSYGGQGHERTHRCPRWSESLEPVVPEHISEVRGGGRDYVIRAQPKGLPKGIGGLSVWIVFVSLLWRWVRREKAWVVQVRAREHDPLGEVLHEEEVLGDRQARDRVAALGRDLRSGKPPWDATGGV